MRSPACGDRPRSPRRFRLFAAAAAALCSFLGAASASAHALDPVLFELKERADGNIDVTWKAPNARVPGVDLRPQLPPECSTVGEVTKEEEEDATISRWVSDCGGSLVGRTVGVLGLESTDALLRVVLASGAVDRRVLGASNPSMVVEGEPSRLDVLHDYGLLGAEHIAGGIDHLLFVFGLLLLTGGTRLLLATVTAFTLGHSVTLALAVPAGSTLLRRRPWAMAFSFGLLHGLGFAGALREAGLPASDVPLALLSFNIGIEVGQVVFVGVVLALLALLRPALGALPHWASRVPVYAMGTASAYWILSRAALVA